MTLWTVLSSHESPYPTCAGVFCLPLALASSCHSTLLPISEIKWSHECLNSWDNFSREEIRIGLRYILWEKEKLEYSTVFSYVSFPAKKVPVNLKSDTEYRVI